MINKGVVIFGSSSSVGNTYRISKEIADKYTYDLVDLNDYNFGYFDYQFKNRNDEFLPLMKNLIANYSSFVFSTPVYWYAMSGIMKVFFDRLTDLLELEPEWVKKLEGVQMYSVSNSADKELQYPFELPFQLTAQYLKMEYMGHQHYINTIKNPTLIYLKEEL